MELPTPAFVPFEDLEMYKVDAPGWYLFDDNHRPVAGPFETRDECVKSK